MTRRSGAGVEEWHRGMYVEKVARVALDAEAVPTLVGWIRERVQAEKPMDAWVRALGAACTAWRFDDGMNGAPALLRALCEAPETESIAIELLAGQHEPVTTREAVLKHASRIEQQLPASAWRRRSAARMTADDVDPGRSGPHAGRRMLNRVPARRRRASNRIPPRDDTGLAGVPFDHAAKATVDTARVDEPTLAARGALAREAAPGVRERFAGEVALPIVVREPHEQLRPPHLVRAGDGPVDDGPRLAVRRRVNEPTAVLLAHEGDGEGLARHRASSSRMSTRR